MKNKTKMGGLMVVFLAMLLVVSMGASAIGQFMSPNATAGDTIDQDLMLEIIFMGNESYNVLIADQSNDDMFISDPMCNVTITSTLTSDTYVLNSTWINGFSNNTWNYTLPAAIGLDDANNYSMTAICMNETGAVTANISTTDTGFAYNNIIDLTAPTISATESSADASLISGVPFITTKSLTLNATVTSAQSCRIHFTGHNYPTPTRSWDFNVTSGKCTGYWGDWTLSDGIYEYIIEATDGYNGTNLSKSQFQVDDGATGMSNIAKAQRLKAAGYTSISTASGTWDLNTFALWGENATSNENIGVVVIVAFLLYIVLSKKKK